MIAPNPFFRSILPIELMEYLRKNSGQSNLAIVEIFEQHYNAILFFGLKITRNKELIEDCIQDLFLKFCENQKLIHNAENIEAYMKASLRRLILKKIDHNAKSIPSTLKFLEIAIPSYEEVLISKQQSLQQSLQMKEALEHLSTSQKTILTMRFYRSMSYDDIASKLGITKRTVYNQIHDSIKKMRGIYPYK